jgi:hypothetical protein
MDFNNLLEFGIESSTHFSLNTIWLPPLLMDVCTTTHQTLAWSLPFLWMMVWYAM